MKKSLRVGRPRTDVADRPRRYESWETRMSPDGSELWFNWVLRLRTDDELIGHVQVGVTLDHATVAWILGSQWQNHGYATEAAKAIREWLLEGVVSKIRASINPAHAASIRVAERVGLVRTNEASGSELIWKLSASARGLYATREGIGNDKDSGTNPYSSNGSES